MKIKTASGTSATTLRTRFAKPETILYNIANIYTTNLRTDNIII